MQESEKLTHGMQVRADKKISIQGFEMLKTIPEGGSTKVAPERCQFLLCVGNCQVIVCHPESCGTKDASQIPKVLVEQKDADDWLLRLQQEKPALSSFFVMDFECSSQIDHMSVCSAGQGGHICPLIFAAVCLVCMHRQDLKSVSLDSRLNSLYSVGEHFPLYIIKHVLYPFTYTK